VISNFRKFIFHKVVQRRS